MRPLKILWLTAHPHPNEGSVGTPWIISLIDQLARRPAEVALTVLGTGNNMAAPEEYFEAAGVQYVYLLVPERAHDIRTLFRRRIAIITAYLRRHSHEYDLIHVHGSESQLHVPTAGLAVPVLLSVQGIVWEYLKVLPVADPMRRFLWLLASYYELRYLRGVRDVSCRTTWDTSLSRRYSPGCHVHINWEMIRPQFFSLNALTTPVPKTGPVQLLFLGGTQVMKGYRETLEAFHLIRQQIPARLVLVGQTQPERISRCIRRRRLTAIGPGDLEYRGMQSVDELLALLQSSFCLLHPSYIDNSPNTVCEAQVAGLPVVATLVGGVGSLLEHERTGLAARLDPRDIADQVLRLYHDEPLRQRIGREAMRVARIRHDPATITQGTLDTYRAIIARERPAQWASTFEAPAGAAELMPAVAPLAAAS